MKNKDLMWAVLTGCVLGLFIALCDMMRFFIF